jgi:hypothetical protein
MKLRAVIKDHFNQQAKKDIKHISAVEKQILARIQREKELEEELEDFKPTRSFWSFQFPLAFATVVVIVLFVSVLGSSTAFAKSPIIEALVNLRNALQEELTQLLSSNPDYRDKGSQRYKQAQNEWCLVSARSPEEQEMAISAIRDFVGKPGAEVEYECVNRNPNNADEEVKTETYTLDFDYFVIDVKTNQIIKMEPLQGTWGESDDGSMWHSPKKNLDYTYRYSLEETEEIARKFLTDHEYSVGKFDLTQFELNSVSKSNEAGNTTYSITWSKEDSRISIVYTQAGQMISFSNEKLQ